MSARSACICAPSGPDRSAADGWNAGTTIRPLTVNRWPRTRVIDTSGPSAQRVAKLPSVQMTAGSTRWTWRRSQPLQVSTSSGSGSRFAGGRHFRTFAMTTWERSMPTSATPLDVLTAFVPTFVEHDLYRGLDVLGTVPTLVIGGTKDKVTKYEHSQEIARRTPGAQLVTLNGAGHMLMAERAPLVNLHLRAFLRRAARSGGAAARGA